MLYSASDELPAGEGWELVENSVSGKSANINKVRHCCNQCERFLATRCLTFIRIIGASPPRCAVFSDGEVSCHAVSCMSKASPCCRRLDLAQRRIDIAVLVAVGLEQLPSHEVALHSLQQTLLTVDRVILCTINST